MLDYLMFKSSHFSPRKAIFSHYIKALPTVPSSALNIHMQYSVLIHFYMNNMIIYDAWQMHHAP